MRQEEYDYDSDNFEDDECSEDNSSHSGTRVHAGRDEKRYHHNLLERRRRCEIKDSFQKLRKSIPSLKGEGKAKTSRAQILKTASEYIGSLTETHAKYRRKLLDLKEEKIRLEKGMKYLQSLKSMKFENKASSLCSSSVSKKEVKGPSSLSSKRNVNVSSDLSSTKVVIPSSVPSSRKNGNDNTSWLEYDTSNVNIFSDLSNTSSDYSDVNSTGNDSGSSFIKVETNIDDSSSSDESSISKTAYDSSYSRRYTTANDSSNLNSVKKSDDEVSRWFTSFLDFDEHDFQSTQNWNNELGLLNLSSKTDNLSSCLNQQRTFDDALISSSSSNGMTDGDTCLNKLSVNFEEDDFNSSSVGNMSSMDNILDLIPIKEESIDIIYNGYSVPEDLLDPCQPTPKRFRNL